MLLSWKGFKRWKKIGKKNLLKVVSKAACRIFNHFWLLVVKLDRLTGYNSKLEQNVNTLIIGNPSIPYLALKLRWFMVAAEYTGHSICPSSQQHFTGGVTSGYQLIGHAWKTYKVHGHEPSLPNIRNRNSSTQRSLRLCKALSKAEPRRPAEETHFSSL